MGHLPNGLSEPVSLDLDTMIWSCLRTWESVLRMPTSSLQQQFAYSQVLSRGDITVSAHGKSRALALNITISSAGPGPSSPTEMPRYGPEQQESAQEQSRGDWLAETPDTEMLPSLPMDYPRVPVP